ncbi:MAG: hypothetical protein ACPGSB_07115, partial [Opitutales bacterium]
NEALQLLESNFRPSLAESIQSDWPMRMVEAALAARKFTHLEHLVSQYPHTLFKNETAALWWCRAQMHRQFWLKAENLMARWPEEQRQLPNRWSILKADHLMLRNEPTLAIEELQSWSGEGQDEVNRQLRLALLAGDDMGKIAEALNAAYRAMPTSPELRLTAAQYYERSGQLAFARREYVAAFLLAPENPFHGHQLAEYYMRTLALPQAIETWRQTYDRTGDARAWWRIWFWESVTWPRGDELEVASGDWWGRLPIKLAKKDEAAFINEALYSDEIPPILRADESFHWLRCFEALRRRDEARALTILESMPTEAVPLAPNLRLALIALLDWRVRGDWPRGVVLGQTSLTHRFLRFMEGYRPAVSPDADELSGMDAFFASDAAPAAVVLAHGWLGAADRLFMEQSIPASTPTELEALNWLPYAFCKMKARLYGPEAALAAAEPLRHDPSVRGYAGEMLLLDGQTEKALAELLEVAADPGGAGYRASYLLALARLDQRDFEGFKAIMSARHDLSESVSGTELRARMAQLTGDRDLALGIYQSLADNSLEGMVYRYRAALLEGDASKARELVQALLNKAPNEPRFHQWQRELDANNG